MTAASWALEQDRRHLTRKVLYWIGVVDNQVQSLMNLVAADDHPVRLHYVSMLRDSQVRLAEYELALEVLEVEMGVAA